MKNKGFRPGFGTFALAFLLAAIGIYLNSKTANNNKIALTQESAKKTTSLNNDISNQTEKSAQANSTFNSPVPLPPGANLLTRERIYTEEEIDKMSIDEFKTLINETDKKLPTKADIKELPPGALHHTPQIVIEAGRNLGLIKEVLTKHEEFVQDAIPFYEKCSLQEEGTTTVRALCLTNLIIYKKKLGEPVNLKKYPKQLVDLTRIVTDL